MELLCAHLRVYDRPRLLALRLDSLVSHARIPFHNQLARGVATVMLACKLNTDQPNVYTLCRRAGADVKTVRRYEWRIFNALPLPPHMPMVLPHDYCADQIRPEHHELLNAVMRRPDRFKPHEYPAVVAALTGNEACADEWVQRKMARIIKGI